MDAVPTAARLYEKHGFISSGKKISWYTLYLDRTSQDTHPHNMMQYSDAVTEVKITDVKALEHLIALDGLITGFKRSQVYKTLIQTPDWRFWTVAGSSDNYGPLEQKHSYIGARPIPGGYGIGPIYAQSLEHAILLVRHAVASLTTISQTPADKLHFAVEACSYNGQIVELFQACGWTEDDYHYHVSGHFTTCYALIYCLISRPCSAYNSECGLDLNPRHSRHNLILSMQC